MVVPQLEDHVVYDLLQRLHTPGLGVVVAGKGVDRQLDDLAHGFAYDGQLALGIVGERHLLCAQPLRQLVYVRRVVADALKIGHGLHQQVHARVVALALEAVGELYEEVVRAVGKAVDALLARVDGGGHAHVVAVQLLEGDVYVLGSQRTHAADGAGCLGHGEGRGDEQFLVQHGELGGLCLLLRVCGDELYGELHELVHKGEQHDGRRDVEKALEVCNVAAVHGFCHQLRDDSRALQYAHDYHKDDCAYDVEEDVRHAGALGVPRGAEGAEEGCDDAGAYVDAHDERIHQLEGHRPRDGERLQHADDGGAALDDDGDGHADDDLEHGHLGKAREQVHKGLGLREGRNCVGHSHHAGEEDAEAHADLARALDAALFDEHDEDNADYECRRSEGRGLEYLEHDVAGGLYIHEADDLRRYRGADVRAHDYADRLPQCEYACGQQADRQDYRGRGGLDYGSDQHAGQQPRKGVPRQLLQQNAQRIARTLFEALAHDLHAVEEHGQAAKHGYDAEDIHTYTPL